MNINDKLQNFSPFFIEFVGTLFLTFIVDLNRNFEKKKLMFQNLIFKLQ